MNLKRCALFDWVNAKSFSQQVRLGEDIFTSSEKI